MNYYLVLDDRINELTKLKHQKVIDFNKAREQKRYGLAQVIGEEILGIQTKLKANYDMFYYMFGEIERENYGCH